MNTELIPLEEIQEFTCRMGVWRVDEEEAAKELNRLLSDGWLGTLHHRMGIWLVDVVRPGIRCKY